jgi:hypothetical protein
MDSHSPQVLDAATPAPGTVARLPASPQHTRPADLEAATRPGELWPEAADARCSAFAALFADSQPANLTVV